jgi:hypothetical protein
MSAGQAEAVAGDSDPRAAALSAGVLLTAACAVGWWALARR